MKRSSQLILADIGTHVQRESIAWFGSWPPPLPPLPSTSCHSFSVFLCVAGLSYWQEREKGVGWGLGAKSLDREKVWSSILIVFNFNYQVVSSVDMKACLFAVDCQESMGFRKLSWQRELNQHFLFTRREFLNWIPLSNILCINV